MADPGTPVTLSRESISDLADVIMRRTPTGGGGGGGGGGGVNMSGAGNAAKGVIDSSISGLGKLASGSFSAADALGVATGVINKVPVIGETISNVVGKVGNAGLQLNKDLNEAGKYGVSLNNDLGMFGKGLAYSRMSSEEFVRGMERNSNGLGVLGGTADRAAKNFMGLAKDFQENPVARQLQETGISASEMNGFLTQQLVNRRTLDITDAKARQAAIEATLSLNVEMDALARQTGKSRQAQMDDLKREQSKAEVQAALMQMGEGARKQFDAMQVSMGPLGKAAQSLASEIATGGVRTKEGAAQLAAMGPAGASFQAAVKQQMAARTDEEKKAAEAAMKRAQNEITAYQRTDQYLSMVRVDQQSEVGKARAQQFMENQYINSQIASENENRGKTQAELEAIRKKEIADAQSGKQTAALGGTPDGSKAGQAINQSKIVAQDIRAGMGPYFEKANDLAGKSVDYLKDISNKTPNLKALMSQGNAEEKTAQMSGAMKSLTPNVLLGTTASSNPANRPAGMGSVTAPAGGRSEGSLGAVGKLIEDFGKGTPMMLHGKEGVITEKQLNSIVGQTMAAGKKSVAAPQNIMGQFAPMISDMQTQMKSKMVEVQSQMPTIDSMKGMFGGMGVPQSAPPSEAPPAPTGGNNATLNEVVGSLDMLNKQMAQLLSQHDEIGRLQVRATKSTSGNRLAA
jgi:hypothetical protein